jgi:hypothetical protein
MHAPTCVCDGQRDGDEVTQPQGALLLSKRNEEAHPKSGDEPSTVDEREEEQQV